jgi:hypothetical protein
MDKWSILTNLELSVIRIKSIVFYYQEQSMSSLIFWFFIFGGGGILTDYLNNQHKQKMKQMELQEVQEANRTKELEIMSKYGQKYFENKQIIQDRLFESMIGEDIQLDNKAQKDILDSFEKGEEI